PRPEHRERLPRRARHRVHGQAGAATGRAGGASQRRETRAREEGEGLAAAARGGVGADRNRRWCRLRRQRQLPRPPRPDLHARARGRPRRRAPGDERAGSRHDGPALLAPRRGGQRGERRGAQWRGPQRWQRGGRVMRRDRLIGLGLLALGAFALLRGTGPRGLFMELVWLAALAWLALIAWRMLARQTLGVKLAVHGGLALV